MVQKQAQAERRPRGRPRQFDPEQAVAEAMRVFWDAGYAATSLDDLTSGMALNRPSLYGAFGDKRRLYAAALTQYRAGARAAVQAALRPDLPLRQGFANLYDRALALYLSGEQGPRGCFLIGTALTESVRDAAARADLNEALREIDAAFETRLRHAVASGELPPGTDPHARALLASAALHSLAIRSRAGEMREALQAIVNAALDAICAGDTASK